MKKIDVSSVEEPKKKKRKIRIKIIVIVLGLSILVGLFFFSGIFSLKKENISIAGVTSFTNVGKINEILSKSIGKNELLIGRQQLEELIGSTGGIENINITKKWPDGLHIVLQTKNPVLQINTGKDFIPIDNDGIEMVHKKTHIKNIPDFTLSKGQKIDDFSIRETAKIADIIMDELKKDTLVWSAKNSNSISVLLNNKTTIVFADSSQLELKIKALKAILQRPDVLADNKIIDLTNPAKPIMKK
jgi:cell division septal protein FtsQ